MNTKIASIQKLYSKFPMLTEANQQYVLSFAEGLKKAQNNRPKVQLKRGKDKQKEANG